MNKEKLDKYKIKYRRIAEMKIAGISETEIAKSVGCSHQNINEILKKYFFDENIPILKKGVKAGHSKFGYFTKKCEYKNCDKSLKLSKTQNNLSKKFCSQICYLKSAGRNTNVNVRQMTTEQYKKYHRERLNKYYHKHKNNPHFIELRKKYNKTARLNKKRKLELSLTN